jgi:CBS domain-containing protein
MKVSECMSHEIMAAAPEHTIQLAARTMNDLAAGFLPVCDDSRVVGVLTDRDIAVRGVAAGLSPHASVRDVMTEEVKYCFDDDDTDEVLENMGEIQVRRLPVVNREKRLVGIVSLSDLARGAERSKVGETLDEIAEPSGQHSQSD